MTTDDHKARAREIVAAIERQNEIEHGDATNWCPEFAHDTIATALAEAEARALERAVQIAVEHRIAMLESADRLGRYGATVGKERQHCAADALQTVINATRALIQPASKGGGDEVE